jgi:Nif11 domain
MTIKSIVNFFAVVKENKSLQRKVQMATDVETIVEMARECNLNFTGGRAESRWL